MVVYSDLVCLGCALDLQNVGGVVLGLSYLRSTRLADAVDLGFVPKEG